MNVWNIDCKFAKDDSEPETIAFTDITKCIDEAAELNCKSIYLELLSSAIKKERKIVEPVTEDEVPAVDVIEEDQVSENEDIEQNDNI